MSLPIVAVSPSPSPPLSLSPASPGGDRDVDVILAALESKDVTSKPLDLAAVLKSPEKLKKACRAGITTQQRPQVWKALLNANTQSQRTHTAQRQP